jgi:hypothetical protein
LSDKIIDDYSAIPFDNIDNVTGAAITCQMDDLCQVTSPSSFTLESAHSILLQTSRSHVRSWPKAAGNRADSILRLSLEKPCYNSYPLIFFNDQEKFSDWLEEHPEASELWVGYFRKSTGRASLRHHLVAAAPEEEFAAIAQAEAEIK